MLAAAPSHAGIKTGVVHGFTGDFAPANWSLVPGNAGNSVAFDSASNPTSLSIVKNNTNSATASATVGITNSLIEALRPAAGYALVGWKATGKYTWTGTNLNRLVFTGSSDGEDGVPNPFSNGSTPVTSPAAFSVAGTPAFMEDTLALAVARVTAGASTGTGTITDFKFVAEYDVPGPLPIVGAAAAFAWSRKLRNRLKSANTLA
jgi:hypothetical protein